MNFKNNVKLTKRRSVAPVIATLLMVAIAVVGGMLVFVFAQDFFTSTDSLAGPTIELLQMYGYDARDHANSGLENHAGITCTTKGTAGGTLETGDTIAIYVRNLGSNPIIINSVSINNSKLVAMTSTTIATTPIPINNNWGVVLQAAGDPCGATAAASGNAVGPGSDATVLATFLEDPNEIKLGRPVFIKIETSSGNLFTKQVVNGRQVG